MGSWAIIKTGGKQYKVAEGDKIDIEKVKKSDEGVLTFDEVLLVSYDENVIIGTPLVAKAKVKAKIIETFKGKKVRVVKFKSKSRYLRTAGHRQQKTKVLIEKIHPS